MTTKRIALPRWWPTAIPLAMLIATEYKVRYRPLGQALSGSVDPTIMVELAVYALVGAFLVYYFARPIRIRPLEPVLFGLWTYTIITAVSSLYSIYPMQGLARGVQLVVIASVAQALASHASRAQMYKLAAAFLVLVSCSAVFGFAIRYPPVTPLQVGRFTWLYVHPVIAGVFLAVAFTISVAFTAMPRPVPGVVLWPRQVTGLIAAVTGVALLLTKTRGSIIVGAVAGLAVIVITRPKLRRPETVLAVVTFGSLVVVAAGSLILRYLERGENAEELATLSNRTVLWSIVWRDFLHQPLFGYGFTASRGLFFDEVKLGGAHNAVINVMIDAGVIGLLAWVGFLVAVVVAVRRTYHGPFGRTDAAITGGVLVCLLVNSFTTEGLGSGVSVSAMWLYLIAAWTVVSRRERAATDAASAHRRGARRHELEHA